MDPVRKAAAHEAGHLLMNAAFGFVIGHVFIWEDDDIADPNLRWKGEMKRILMP
jgi:hypothetical protein